MFLLPASLHDTSKRAPKTLRQCLKQRVYYGRDGSWWERLKSPKGKQALSPAGGNLPGLSACLR